MLIVTIFLVAVTGLRCLVVGGGAASSKAWRVKTGFVESGKGSPNRKVVDVGKPCLSLSPKYVEIGDKPIYAQELPVVFEFPNFGFSGRGSERGYEGEFISRGTHGLQVRDIGIPCRPFVIGDFRKVGGGRMGRAFPSIYDLKAKSAIDYFRRRISEILELKRNPRIMRGILGIDQSFRWLPNSPHENPRSLDIPKEPRLVVVDSGLNQNRNELEKSSHSDGGAQDDIPVFERRLKISCFLIIGGFLFALRPFVYMNNKRKFLRAFLAGFGILINALGWALWFIAACFPGTRILGL